MQQGNDSGIQYHSGLYVYSEQQKQLAEKTKTVYQKAIEEKRGASAAQITTEILDAGEFYFAVGYHQQYLAKNPKGYCGLGEMGISCS
jgi:peptide-methionine (S)-S-oxide reductase